MKDENKENICHLCGKSIAKEDFSREHLPTKQFFPKEIRIQENLNLLRICFTLFLKLKHAFCISINFVMIFYFISLNLFIFCK